MPRPDQAIDVQNLAGELYDLLPGSSPYADYQQFTFPAVAATFGLGHHWPGGSKRPAIATLLAGTLDSAPTKLGPLISAIITTSMRRYPQPMLTREGSQRIVLICKRLGHELPNLQRPEFVSRLPHDQDVPRDETGRRTEGPTTPAPVRRIDLSPLRPVYEQLHTMQPQERGYAFEGFLTGLWNAYEWEARNPFRLTGQQIDGSFGLDHLTFLVEAKWQNRKMDAADLFVFDGKVRTKPDARGLFVSYSGFTSEGLQAFQAGNVPTIICVDGFDLHCVIQGDLSMLDVIKRKRRAAAEGKGVFVSVRDLFPEKGFF